MPALVEENPDPVEKVEEEGAEEEEGEELECMICCQPPTILTEDLEEEEEVESEEEEVADVRSSTVKRATKRKAHTKKVVPKLPDAPSFDNIFLHTKLAHGGHPNLPPALLLGEALPLL